MRHPHGKISWTDLQISDPKAATSFYGQLFGWQAEEAPTGQPGVSYFLLRKGGKQVAGIGPPPPGLQQPGTPQMWTAYVNVDDVDKIATHGSELGATVLVPPGDVMDTGRIAILADPTGAVIGFWQPGTQTGAEVLHDPGSMTWVELATRDTEKAREFYTTLLPWDVEEKAFDGGVYTMFRLGGEDAAGMYAMDESWPREVPAHWMVYFAVDDTDATVKRIEELGGRISVPPSDSPYGRFAVVSDPQGGTFSIVKVTRPS
jgi:predicted enzyme related to lactoylglutathione lyase